MRAAVIQMNSTADRERNLEVAGRLVSGAAADGAELVVLPEKWPLFTTGEAQAAAAENPDGRSLTAARDWARGHRITLAAGSITMRPDGSGKPRNTTFVISPGGEILATFSKLHLFDVDAGGVAYRESDFEDPGEETALVDLPGGGSDVPGGSSETIRMGLAICYDLRFPELFRELTGRGAKILALPSGFTAATGRDHWEPLVRARAIENQAFVLAPNQYGKSGPDLDSWGHSMIVDPWGDVLATVDEGEGFVCADLDFARQAEVRAKLPALDHRRPGLFGGDSDGA